MLLLTLPCSFRLGKITIVRLWAYHRDLYYPHCYVPSFMVTWKKGSSSSAKILRACASFLTSLQYSTEVQRILTRFSSDSLTTTYTLRRVYLERKISWT